MNNVLQSFGIDLLGSISTQLDRINSTRDLDRQRDEIAQSNAVDASILENRLR